MDYFQHAGIAWDDRMAEAIAYLNSKQNRDGTWNVQAAHPGQVHFTMKYAVRPSRWNTFRMLRIKNTLGLSDEVSYVLEGITTFLVGDNWVDAGKVTFLRIPAKNIHGFKNSIGIRSGVLNLSTPGC